MPSKSVLVVDDDYDIRFTLGEILREEGYEVSTASNGEEALELLRRPTSTLPTGVILLDLNMPVMNGWQFRSRQRADAGIAGIPVIIVSATSDVVQRASEMAASGVLKKPVELETLMTAIEPYCR